MLTPRQVSERLGMRDFARLAAFIDEHYGRCGNCGKLKCERCRVIPIVRFDVMSVTLTERGSSVACRLDNGVVIVNLEKAA